MSCDRWYRVGEWNGKDTPTRPAICPECQAPYQQCKPAWLERLKPNGYDGPMADGWTPDVCPKCARILNNMAERRSDRRLSPEGRMDVAPLPQDRQIATPRERRAIERRVRAPFGERE